MHRGLIILSLDNHSLFPHIHVSQLPTLRKVGLRQHENTTERVILNFRSTGLLTKLPAASLSNVERDSFYPCD